MAIDMHVLSACLSVCLSVSLSTFKLNNNAGGQYKHNLHHVSLFYVILKGNNDYR